MVPITSSPRTWFVNMAWGFVVAIGATVGYRVVNLLLDALIGAAESAKG